MKFGDALEALRHGAKITNENLREGGAHLAIIRGVVPCDMIEHDDCPSLTDPTMIVSCTVPALMTPSLSIVFPAARTVSPGYQIPFHEMLLDDWEVVA